MPEPVKLKRPSAHRWAIGLLCFTMVPFAIVLSDVVTGRPGPRLWQYWFVAALLTSDAFALFCLIVGGRHRWAYYVTSGVLGIWALRGVYNVLFYAWLLAFGKGPVPMPNFYRTEYIHPSIVPVLSLSSRVIVPAVVALIVWVFIRFTFTRESRSYFQFKKSAGVNPGEPGKSTKQHDEAPTLT